MIEHRHAEAQRGAARDCLADAAEAEYADGLAMDVPAEQVRADVAGPASFPHQCRKFDQAPAARHDQREYRVGGGLGQHARRVAKHDAAGMQFRQRIVVHAHRDAGDDFQPRRARQHGCVDRITGADHTLGDRQRGLEGGALLRQTRIGDGDIVYLRYAGKLIRGQLTKYQHLLALFLHHAFLIVPQRQAPRASAGLRCRPAPAPRARLSMRRVWPHPARCALPAAR